jgi:hypothetical protein
MHTKDKGTRLYLLDIAQRKIINSCPLPEQFHALPELPSAFLHGRHLYLPGEKSIVRTPVGQTELKVWWKETVTEEEQTSDGAWWQYRYKPISAPGAVLNNRYYYASSWRLRSIELPPAE